MKCLFAFILCIILSSCSEHLEGTDHKNKNGLFVSTVTASKFSETSCSNQVEFKNPPPFTIAAYGPAEDGSDFPENTVYLFDSEHQCSEVVDFFPVGLVTITNQNSQKKITVGIPVSPDQNPKETTDFFRFQIDYAKQLKSTTDWIENNYDQAWLVTGWKDEKTARSHLERIIRGF
ncbi:MAG: hypothetical protein AB8B53_09620 [Flavobacteriales bacterium]